MGTSDIRSAVHSQFDVRSRLRKSGLHRMVFLLLSTNLHSFDHLIRPCQHIRWNRQADLLGRFWVDDEFKLRRLFHRQVGGLSALQNFIHIDGGAPGLAVGGLPAGAARARLRRGAEHRDRDHSRRNVDRVFTRCYRST